MVLLTGFIKLTGANECSVTKPFENIEQELFIQLLSKEMRNHLNNEKIVKITIEIIERKS